MKGWVEEPSGRNVLTELLLQLADDDFILAYRGSEWLGLAPHVEEDVAFSSINQDTMGHAVMYYRLLEELGVGEANELSHGRSPEAFRNAVLLEEKNGPGEYSEEPHYDWAFTVVRHYFYDINKNIRLASLARSSYSPLSEVARKIAVEQTYHIMHWDVWFRQLMQSTAEARQRMEKAIARVWRDLGGIVTLGPYGEEMTRLGLIEDEQTLQKRFLQEIKKVFNKVNYEMKEKPGMERGDGRAGVHTQDLREALAILSEVYLSDPEVVKW